MHREFLIGVSFQTVDSFKHGFVLESPSQVQPCRSLEDFSKAACSASSGRILGEVAATEHRFWTACIYVGFWCSCFLEPFVRAGI